MSLTKMSERDYRNAEGLNKSLLVPFMRSPRHYLAELAEPKEATDSMNLGTALHAELLQPARASFIYAVMKKVDRRTNAGKEYAAQFEAENAGKVNINEEQKKALDGMRNSVMFHPAARRLIERATHLEQPMFSTYKASTVDHSFKTKAMADGIIEPEGVMFDLKTTDNAMDFAKKVRAFRYDIQQVHYQLIGANNGIAPNKFAFIVVENVAPYGTMVVTLEPEKMLRTAEEYKQAMEFYAHCHQKQDFNVGYNESEVVLHF